MVFLCGNVLSGGAVFRCPVWLFQPFVHFFPRKRLIYTRNEHVCTGCFRYRIPPYPRSFRRRNPPGTQCRARRSRGVARGEAPCIRKLRSSPFPGVGRALCERGSGGWGRKAVQRADRTGNTGTSPPTGHRTRNNHAIIQLTNTLRYAIMRSGFPISDKGDAPPPRGRSPGFLP